MSSGKFRELKTYLAALPETLPLPSDSSKINRLLDFSLNENWVTDAGIEGALNWEIKAALGDFLPHNNDGIFFVKEQGEVIKGLADILKMYNGPGHMLEGSALIKKMAQGCDSLSEEVHCK